MAQAVRLHGFKETSQAFGRMGGQINREWRDSLSDIGEPVRSTAEANAYSRIPRIGKSWGEMRTGVTQKAVYVAPKQRQTRNPALKRRKFAGLLMERAMEPALNRHEQQTVQRVERLLDHVGRENGF
jgi:hypothetical protein